MKIKKRYIILVLLIISVISLFVGVADITPLSILQQKDPEKIRLLMISRVPRLISIWVTGAGLSVAGVIMQQISGNRFISPSTAGTMEFTRLGVLVAITLVPGARMMEKMLVAFCFALGGTFLFMQIINRIKLKDSIFIPLVGMMFGGIISSITTFFAYQYDLIQNINSWLQGSFSLVIKGRYELLYVGIPVLVLIYICAKQFTIAGLGSDMSKNLGLNYQAIVNIGLIFCALMSAVIVVSVGSIPFVGIIVPNIVSLYRGDNLQETLPYTALLGAVYILICDIIGRLLIYPFEIPISVTAGTIGSALFLYLILRKKTYAAKD